MDTSTRNLILEIMAAKPDLTIATLRPDGWPQATTVSYANDGLVIYFAAGRQSQKVRNIRECPRVSLTIDKPYGDWNHIQSLSMAAHAEIISDPSEIECAIGHLSRRFPQTVQWTGELSQIAFIKLTPKIISVLDYTKGFGHTQQFEI